MHCKEEHSRSRIDRDIPLTELLVVEWAGAESMKESGDLRSGNVSEVIISPGARPHVFELERAL